MMKQQHNIKNKKIKLDHNNSDKIKLKSRTKKNRDEISPNVLNN